MATSKQLTRALDFFADELSQRPNVVGLGIVPLVEGLRDEWAIGVYVSKKVPKDQLQADEIVPAILQLPGRSQVVPIPTRVIEQGPVHLEGRESL